MSVLPLKHIIVTLLSPSTIMPSKTTLGSSFVVHNCCLSCVRRPMPYILIFSAVRLVYPFLRPKTSCIAKKGPSPRYARKSKFTLVRVRLPPLFQPKFLFFSPACHGNSRSSYWLAKSHTRFFLIL